MGVNEGSPKTIDDEKNSASRGQGPERDILPSSSPPSQMQIDENNGNENDEYPSGFKFASIILGVCLSFLLVGLDSTILATAVPTMTRHFGTIADTGWYISVYRMTAASFQFLFGKVYSVFSTKPVMLLSLGLFGLSNLLCALASTSPMFIAGRAVTGFATAGIISGAFSIIIQTTPLRKRSIYAGVGGATEAIATLTAPLVGGLLTDRLSWRWCFFIELPITVLAFIVVMIFFHMSSQAKGESNTAWSKMGQLDLPGTALFVPALTSLMLALQWGGTKHSWSDWRVLITLSSFLVLAAAFGWLQHRRQEQATVPPRILLQRSVAFGFLFSCCNNAALAIMEYYLPIYFQTVKGFSPSLSGIMILPISGGLILSVSLSGFLTSALGYYTPFMILTGIITPPAAGLISTLSEDAKTWRLIIYQAMLGFGAGIGFQGPQVAVQAIFDAKDAQIGIAIIQFAQGIGPAISVAIAQSVFAGGLASSIKHHAPDVNFAGLKDYGLDIPKNQLNHAEYEAILLCYEIALTQTFYVSVSLACLSIIGAVSVEWRSVKR